MTPLQQKVIDLALQDVGVHEDPPGSNSGPVINKMLAVVGLNPGYAWCCASACYWISGACNELGLTHEFSFGASVLKLWQRNQALVIPAPVPGCIALRNEGVNSLGHAVGHCMVVIDVLDDGQTLKVISGNTTAANPNARTGGEVAIQDRPMSQFTDNGYGFLAIR